MAAWAVQGGQSILHRQRPVIPKHTSLVPPKLPDLKASISFNVEREDDDFSKPVTCFRVRPVLKVENLGKGGARNIRVKFNFHSDGCFQSPACQPNGTPLYAHHYSTISYLGPGHHWTYPGEFTCEVFKRARARVHISIYADCDNNVAETSESNNKAEKDFEFQR